MRLLKNLLDAKVIKKFRLKSGSLTKIPDIELVASLAWCSEDDELLSRRICSLVLNQCEVSEQCLAKLLVACSLLPSSVAIMKSEATKDFLFELLRYPRLNMKEPAARLIMQTQKIT